MEYVSSFEQLAKMSEIDLSSEKVYLEFRDADAAMRSKLLMRQFSVARLKLNKQLELDLQQRLAAGEFTKEDLARDYVVVEWVERANMNICLRGKVVKNTEVDFILTERVVRPLSSLTSGPIAIDCIV
jgi:hypothetical protein